MSQICYVIVSRGWDKHTQMAWLSAESVRRQEPTARIVAVVEGLSPRAVDDVARRLGPVVDEVIPKVSDMSDPLGKSRFHKMMLREYVTGDFLYMDSDTLAVAPLAEAFQYSGDVGAVLDCNNAMRSRWFPPNVEQPFHQLGWTYPLPYYLNAGVILMRDTPGVHKFCREWLVRWQASSVLKHVWDQVTMNSALFASTVSHVVLPHRYNVMVVKRNYRCIDGSNILHFFGSEEEQRGTLMAHLLRHLQRTGEFDDRAYERSIRQRHPWGPSPEAWQLHHSGNYVRAAFVKAERAVLRGWQRFGTRRSGGVSPSADQ